MDIQDFVTVFREERASAILRTTSTDAARTAMQAAVRGGFRICEFTMTIPRALDLVAEFAADANLVVGVGTVLTVTDARAAVAAGARFLVSPVVDERIVAEAARLGVAMMPGCATPTEMWTAHCLGAPLQKLFPSPPPGHGPTVVAQTLAPLPMLRIVPTSGVTLENAGAYLKAGAHAVGFVNTLFDPDDIAAGRFEAIERRAGQMLSAVASA
ncbi:MAG: bifunctional 2-keto-4-hydroxyglutarate aldolase/2-keto-3-deoxy-6-phosphogluconate aldolase [Phycisphaerales bacterium]|nr:bifunctional 2-keto-4-hydroxyglutarate aldolase/2-keto-3-deoxy-6-phosphogluconate aldolase [Phycisphaerales bacterium]